MTKLRDPSERKPVPTWDGTRAAGFRPDDQRAPGDPNGPIENRAADAARASKRRRGPVSAEGNAPASNKQRRDAPPRREPEPSRGEFLRRATSVELRALAQYDPATHSSSDVDADKRTKDAWRRGLGKAVDSNLDNATAAKLARQQLQQRQQRARQDGGHRASQPVGRPRMVLGGLALILVLWLLTK